MSSKEENNTVNLGAIKEQIVLHSQSRQEYAANVSGTRLN